MKIESYKQGTPCWTDLSTTDQNGAKEFYSKIFGWEYQDIPMGEGQVYSIAQIDGSDAGAIFTQVAQEAEAGVPPHWKVYLAVDDIVSTASKVSDLGGTVIVEEFDEDESGRMIMAQDPTGAMIQFWQAKENIGAEVRDEHGAINWAELLTTDLDGAGKFYSELLGVNIADGGMPTPEGEAYHMIFVDGEPKGGITNLPPNLREMGVPSHWEVIFAVDDANEVVKTAKSMGAEVIFGPEDLDEIGVVAVMQDPQGAVIGINQPPTGSQPRDRIDVLDSEDKADRREPIPRWAKAELFRSFGGKCEGCLETFNQIGNLDVDHIIPVADGGTNDFDNLQLLCRSCNSKKGTKTMRELVEILINEGIRSS